MINQLLEEQILWAKILGDYYRDISFNYSNYINERSWPVKPKNPFRIDPQKARIERRENKKWLS